MSIPETCFLGTDYQQKGDNMDYLEQNMEISIKDMLFSVLYGWKWIAICALCFCIVLGCFFGIRSVNNDSVMDDTEFQELVSEYETEKEVLEKRVQLLEITLKGQEEYWVNSILMQIDYHNVAKASASIFILPQDDLGATALAAYETLVNDRSFLQSIAENMETQVAYLDELITVNYDERNILSIAVVHDNETDAEVILDEILSFIESEYNSVEKIAGKHSIKILSRYVATEIDDEILNKQIIEKNAMTEWQTALKSANSELNALQTPAEQSEPSVLFSALKGVILGALLGAFLAAVYFACLYLFGNKVFSAEEIHNRLGIIPMGSIVLKSQKGRVSKVIRKLEGRICENSDDNLAMIAERIYVYAGEGSAVLLTGTTSEDDLKAVLNMLKGKMSEIQIESFGNILEKAENLRKMRSSENVVLVETCGKSSYKDIAQEIELIKESNKKLVGCIVIE